MMYMKNNTSSLLYSDRKIILTVEVHGYMIKI